MARPHVRLTMSISVLCIALLLFVSSPAGQPDSDHSLSAGIAAVDIQDPSVNIVVETSGISAFDAVLRLASAHGLEVAFSDAGSGILTLSRPGISGSVLSELSGIEGVLSISSERKARATYIPNDSELRYQWGLDTVNAYEAWDIARGEHDVVVAVLDTGIDWNHPDIAPNIWSDADGYYGYNFIDGNRFPMDDNINSYDELGGWAPNTYTYHGTHVAGVVGAAIGNSIGIAGMAQVRMMAVKVMNDSGEGTDSTVASGVRWAVDHGADIVTMSLGVDGSSSVLSSAISYASNRGVVAVAASGNDGASYVSYPAAYPSVIAVGAVDDTNHRASFSNYGTGLDVMAPGVQIYSTQGGSATPNGAYQYLSGTSTAAPFVAGVAALMLSVNPALSPVEIGAVLNSTAQDLTSMTGYDATTGWGIVDAFAAVELISDPTVTITEYPEYVALNSTFSIKWLVSGGDPGTIQTTYIRWGQSPTSLANMSESFTGTTWATFTVEDIQAPAYNTTLYVVAYANVDGTAYQSDLMELDVREAPPDGLFAQFLKDVHDFIFNELGVYNFLLLLAIIIAIPAVIVAMRPKRRRVPVRYTVAQPQVVQPAPAMPYMPPPPPPPPRFEAYIDVVGHDVLPQEIRVVEGTKVVWVNRAWAPPPGVSVRSGNVDETGEHPDGMFQSGMLIAPGDYWSATFHRVGTYSYYLTGIWKNARIIVEPYRPGGMYGPQQQAS